MKRITRRRALKAFGVAGASTAIGGATWEVSGNKAYNQALEIAYGKSDTALSDKHAILREVVRYATMAPNSHNTQPWRIAIEDSAMVIRPDIARRCPVVDPDDHHIYVSLGCAVENAIHAAGAFGLHADVSFEATTDSLRVEFSRIQKQRGQESTLFEAIPLRQSTRGLFDGHRLTNAELKLLENAAAGPGVQVMMFTERRPMEAILELVIQGNRAQMQDPEFVSELRHWIRSSYFEAVAKGDGLFSKCSGHPAVPEWVGKRLFDLAFTLPAETKKYQEHVRSSAGIAVFIAETESKSNWANIGRSFERFALQATSMGILHSHLNQPVEVPVVRQDFATYLGFGDKRPDLVIRFGRGKAMPKSLRRPQDAVVDS